MFEANLLRSWRPWLGVPLIAALAACSSGPSEDDPAFPYHETRWVDQNTDIELRMDDGAAEFIAHRQDKQFDLTYTVDADGNVVLQGKDQELLKKDLVLVADGSSLRNLFANMNFVEMNAEREQALTERVAKSKALSEARTANRPPSPDGYRLINQSELEWVLASRMLDRLSDENLAEVFVEGYSKRLDAFAKKDLIDRELPAVKAKLEEWAAIQDFRMEAVSDKKLLDPGYPATNPPKLVTQGYPALSEYDTSLGAFKPTISFGSCHGVTNQHRAAGIAYVFRSWPDGTIDDCLVKPHDEQQARAIEAARAAHQIETNSQAYFRFTGEQSNGMFVMDVHRLELTFFNAPFDKARKDYVIEQIGDPIVLTEPNK